MHQVLGPSWLDQDEYDIEARTGEQANREQLDLMLRALIAERFNLRQHRETRVMQVYELRVDQAGAKVHSTNTGKQAKPGAGFHFHGDMRRFADFLAVQLSIPILDDPTQPGKAGGPAVPVLDRTELPGAYDLAVDVKPELGTDPFTLWQTALREQLGLRIERRRGSVDIVLVDSVARVPVSN